MHRVTVYVPSRNYGRFLRQALDSVFAQAFTGWELLVFNEGSDDQTSTIAREFVIRAPDRVQLIAEDIELLEHSKPQLKALAETFSGITAKAGVRPDNADTAAMFSDQPLLIQPIKVFPSTSYPEVRILATTRF